MILGIAAGAASNMKTLKRSLNMRIGSMEGEKEVSELRCSKCGGVMVEGATPVFGDSFACTRRNQKKLEEQGVDRIRAYYCGNCGYLDFYKEIKKNKK